MVSVRHCVVLVNRETLSLMAIESHLAELKRRHEVLEQQLEEALQQPSVDPLALTEIKRKKLHLKDEITRLNNEILH